MSHISLQDYCFQCTKSTELDNCEHLELDWSWRWNLNQVPLRHSEYSLKTYYYVATTLVIPSLINRCTYVGGIVHVYRRNSGNV